MGTEKIQMRLELVPATRICSVVSFSVIGTTANTWVPRDQRQTIFMSCCAPNSIVRSRSFSKRRKESCRPIADCIRCLCHQTQFVSINLALFCWKDLLLPVSFRKRSMYWFCLGCWMSSAALIWVFLGWGVKHSQHACARTTASLDERRVVNCFRIWPELTWFFLESIKVLIWKAKKKDLKILPKKIM